jgi:acetyltransferase-like isoleucine patch superfamily enzyme
VKRALAQALSRMHRKIHAFEERERAPRFGAIGQGSAIHQPTFVWQPERVFVGAKTVIHPYCRLELLSHNPHIDGPPIEGNPRLEIGDRVVINSFTHIGVMDRVVLGDDVGIASGVCIEDHHYVFDEVSDDKPLKKQGFRVAPVVIEAGCMIGEHAVILPGVTIGKNSWIGANAVVTQDIPPYSIAAGVPAKVIRRLDPSTGRWLRVSGA